MIYGSVSTGSHVEKLVFEDELGWECAFVSEIDKYANQVIRYHAPDIPNLGDFSKIEANERTTRIQLLDGGTPCQPFSVAGLREGLADSRGNLTLEFLALADRLKPTWILWENVPGVLSQDEGRAFGAFLGGLAELGYGFAYRILDAQYFGVPQRRRRVFVVGHLGDWRCAAAVLFERESLSGHPAPSREAGAQPTQALTRGFANGGADDNKAQGGFLVSAPVTTSPHADNEAQESKLIPEVSHALTAQKTATGRLDPNGETFIPEPYQCHGSNVGPMGAMRAGNGNETGGVPFCVTGDRTHALKAEGADASEDGTGRGTPIVALDTTQITSKDNRSNPKPGDPCHPVAAGAHPPVIAFSSKDHGADAGETAPTLRSMNNRDSNVNGGGQVAVAFQEAQTDVREYPEAGTLRANGPGHDPVGTRIREGMRVRRLMPVECERLQGWPDRWTQYGRTKAGEIVEISDTQRYKIIGNGWALPAVRWIAHRIEMIERLTASL